MTGSANVELARAIYAPWERGDFAASDWAHPDMEYVRPEGISAGRWTGHSAIAEGWREFLNVWDDFRIVADEYVELDAERVVVLNHYAGRGRSSGVTLDGAWAEGATLFQIRDGRVIRLVGYFDRDRALADLGLTGPSS